MPNPKTKIDGQKIDNLTPVKAAKFENPILCVIPKLPNPEEHKSFVQICYGKAPQSVLIHCKAGSCYVVYDVDLLDTDPEGIPLAKGEQLGICASRIGLINKDPNADAKVTILWR